MSLFRFVEAALVAKSAGPIQRQEREWKRKTAVQQPAASVFCSRYLNPTPKVAKVGSSEKLHQAASLTLGPSLDQFVAAASDALLDGFHDRPFLKHGALAVTLGLGLQALADLANVDEATFEEVVVDDQVPGGTGRKQSLAIFALHDTVARRLIGMVLEDIGVEVFRIVRHGPGHGRTAVRTRRGRAERLCSAEDLVLGAHLLHLALQPFVLCRGLFLRTFELIQPDFEVFDMAFLALSEGSLAVGGMVLASSDPSWF